MKKIMLFIAANLVAFSTLASEPVTQGDPQNPTATPEVRIENANKVKAAANAESDAAEAEGKALELQKQNAITKSDLDKFGFGLGFGVMSLAEPDIRSALIENGIVRVTDQENNKMGFWLTTSWTNDSWPTHQIGFGPFFGVQLGGNNEIVNSIAAGIDFSFKRISPKLPLDLQIGYGVTRVETLAKGYSDNAAPPSGATQVLTTKTTKKGWVLIFSYKI
jgi:hypothetical protein